MIRRVARDPSATRPPRTQPRGAGEWACPCGPIAEATSLYATRAGGYLVIRRDFKFQISKERVKSGPAVWSADSSEFGHGRIRLSQQLLSALCNLSAVLTPW